MTQPENQAEALKGCPFCGEERIFLNPPSSIHPRGSINCPACLACMPGEVDEREMIASWNQRASLPEAPAVPVVKEEMAERYSAGVDAYWKGRRSGRDGDAVMAGLRSALQSSPPVKAAAVDGEIDRLRKALIAAGRHVGAGLADDVSTDFLMLVPEEVRLVMEQHRAALASQHAVEGEAVAWLKEFKNDGKPGRRVDRSPGSDPWMTDYRETPLYARPAAADAGVREALRELLNAFSIYTVEDDDGIRLSTGGKCIAHYGDHTPEGIAMLKLDALWRAADAALSLAAKRDSDGQA